MYIDIPFFPYIRLLTQVYIEKNWKSDFGWKLLLGLLRLSIILHCRIPFLTNTHVYVLRSIEKNWNYRMRIRIDTSAAFTAR